MKTPVSHIITSIFLSAIFLFAGTGYNLIHYCCSTCADAGIEKVAEMSCEGVHHHHHTGFEHHSHLTDKSVCITTTEDGCGITRLMVDIPAIGSEKNQIVNFLLFNVDFKELNQQLFADLDLSQPVQNLSPFADFPVPLDGREILVQKAVLLI